VALADLRKQNRSAFYVELIKPSHYDDDGYVIQWWKAWIPSNSLSSLYALACDAAQRRVLGPDMDIVVQPYDECNTVIPIRRIIRRFKRNGLRGLVCLVGVQSNQFPRALDLARQFRAANLAVAIGGFHVSGCLAMIPQLPQDLQEALDLGVSLIGGEAEGRFENILCDAAAQRLQSVYNFMDDLPELCRQPTPFLPARYVRRYGGSLSCFDAGRGCPFTCSFCTIINVQGRKSRFRDSDDVERIIRTNGAQGVQSYFITDDNFARNRNWEAILDRIIELREKEGFKTNFVMQVDTLCHKIPNFVEKAARAGCKRVFIGLENINPESLKAAHKGQNQITEYRRMLQAWRNVGVLTYCGYIIGFPGDTPETVSRDIEIVKRELPVDLLEFFILTPLPGSADHKSLWEKGIWMDPDMNKYDLEHVTTGHRLMTADQWQAVYRKAWDIFYTPQHIETLLRRAATNGLSARRYVQAIFIFYASIRYENVHPLQGGLLRRKVRTQRRLGLPRENPLFFYCRRATEMVTTYVPVSAYYLKLLRLRKAIVSDPGKRAYRDTAITPVADPWEEHLALYEATDAAKSALARAKQRAQRQHVSS